MNKEQLLAKAIELYDNSLYLDAFELFDKIIEQNPECEETYFYAGQCCEKMFYEHKAIEYYSKGIMKCLNIEYISDYHLNIGNCCIRLSRIDEAVFHYDKASELEDNYPIAQFNKAIAFLCINDYDEALLIFEILKNNNLYDTINSIKLDKYIEFCKNKTQRDNGDDTGDGSVC